MDLSQWKSENLAISGETPHSIRNIRLFGNKNAFGAILGSTLPAALKRVIFRHFRHSFLQIFYAFM
jgi:hypothetical protein